MENYPIKERTKEESQFLERVKLLRKIEIASKKTSNDLSSEIMKTDNVKEMVTNFFNYFFFNLATFNLFYSS